MGSKLLAHVRNGRLVLDEPSTLPEGAEVELRIVGAVDDDDDDVDDLDAEDRARLHEALAESARQIDQGMGIPVADLLNELRRTHP